MEKNIELISLYDLYGNMLTDRQKEIFELYYISDLSLREIAENKSISYQAVSDSIKSCKNFLVDLEEKLKIRTLNLKLDEIREICVESKKMNNYDASINEKIIQKLEEINKNIFER
ncbi:MAG: DNA-binding protein [Clostridia bacterium]|nr:DNA-binding protein [Clostridia bacterium]